jgi:hypothetical protein
MHRVLRTAMLLPAAAIVFGACAVRLGGPSPQGYDAIAIRTADGASAADVASSLRAANADLVLISAEQDSAWFAAVAQASGLELSGPGMTSGRGFAFLSRLEILGDTSLVLEVPGGGSVHMHDALYRVDRNRYVDLMLVRFDAPDLRAAVRTLFGYIATDVGADAAVLLAIDAAQPAIADSAAVLMRAHYTSAHECRTAAIEPGAVGSIRLLYGPTARISCTTARALPGQPGIHANVVVAR